MSENSFNHDLTMSEPQVFPRPLGNITVLDVTTALAGPFATMLLAGLGARVIKVENPLTGDTCRTNAPYLGKEGGKLLREMEDDISISALNRLRNKLGVTLNLKHPRACEVFADLVRQSDVLVENFSRGVLERLGAGYSVARELNPRLVYCSITGFGSNDDGTVKAMDVIIQALSGVMQTSGNQDEPPVRVGVPFADLITPLFGVIGVLAALHQAQRTGLGQHVDVSMLGAVTSLVAAEHFDLLAKLGVPLRTGQTATRLAPFGVYKAKDGYVAICAPMDGFAHKLFKAMERTDLLADERFKTRDQRVKNVEEVDALVEAWTSMQTVAELLSRLEAGEVPAAEVREPQAAVSDPRVVGRRETVLLEHPKYGLVEEVYGTGIPIQFSEAVVGFDQPAPEIGEHNELVYQQFLGYSEERVEELRSLGVI
jgi:crotonobetainyl-CoA:carnitine CoA-transferase CaiB-like acyl-CoA transferase